MKPSRSPFFPDFDECAFDRHTCDRQFGRCVNVEGSYSCECREGYQGDGRTCTEMDECELGEDDCSDNAQCINTIGSFACQCQEGYRGNGKACTGNFHLRGNNLGAGFQLFSDWVTCQDQGRIQELPKGVCPTINACNAKGEMVERSGVSPKKNPFNEMRIKSWPDLSKKCMKDIQIIFQVTPNNTPVIPLRLRIGRVHPHPPPLAGLRLRTKPMFWL